MQSTAYAYVRLVAAPPPFVSSVSRIGHRVIIRSPLGFCIYECIGCWNFHKGRAKNIRLLWGGGVFTMVPWAKILSDLNLVLTLHYRHCALASIASGGRYHSRSSRRCGRHRTKLNFKASTPWRIHVYSKPGEGERHASCRRHRPPRGKYMYTKFSTWVLNFSISDIYYTSRY